MNKTGTLDIIQMDLRREFKNPLYARGISSDRIREGRLNIGYGILLGRVRANTISMMLIDNLLYLP